MRAQWDGQKSEIASARMTFYYVIVDGEFTKLKSATAVSDVLRRIAPPSSADSSTYYKNIVSEELLSAAGNDFWKDGRLVLEGSGKSRFTTYAGENLEKDSLVLPDDEVIADRRNGQISLIPPGSSKTYRHGIRDFRLTPQLSSQQPDTFDVFANGNTMTISSDTLELQVDRDTALLRALSSKDGQGNVRRQRFQIGADIYPDGIFFPSMSVDAIYHGSQLYLLTVFIAKQYEFNIPLPPSEFTIASFSDGSNVFDYRHKINEEPAFFRAPPGVTDIVEYSNERASIRSALDRTPIAIRGETSPRYMLWLNIAVAIALAMYIYYARKRQRA